MAKKFMTSTWSWDHCFNALAMADLGDRTMAKQIALYQFSAPFYLQTEQGVLPDTVCLDIVKFQFVWKSKANNDS